MPCVIPGCDKPVYRSGWCAMHVTRWRRHRDVHAKHGRGPSKNPKPRRRCSVPGCDELHAAKGYCPQHYRRRAAA